MASFSNTVNCRDSVKSEVFSMFEDGYSVPDVCRESNLSKDLVTSLYAEYSGHTIIEI